MEEVTEIAKELKYPVYKSSGVDWIGKIPAHWETRKLKHLFYEKRKTSNTNLKCGSISFGKVIEKDDEKIPEATKASYQEVLKGDFLINPLNLNYDLISLRIALAGIDVVVSSGYIVLRNSTKIDLSYYKWLLHRYDVAYMKLLGSGVRQTINFGDIADSLLIFPPLEEQTRIAQFLDRKTAQIDKAIAQKERLIELLKERRQILIHNAVTKGLNPNAKMKDSGVEWIGEVPEHWEVKRIKHVADKFMYGTSVDCNDLTEGTPVLRIPNVDDLTFNLNDLKYASLTPAETEKYLLKENDILVIRTNGNPELVGKSAMFKGSEKFMFASYLIRLKPKSHFIIPGFLIRLMNSFLVRGALTLSARTSVGNYNLNTQSLGDCFIPYPPQEEQKGIMDFIENQSSRMNDSLLLQQDSILKLKEYKASLINSAVTGKIKI